MASEVIFARTRVLHRASISDVASVRVGIEQLAIEFRKRQKPKQLQQNHRTNHTRKYIRLQPITNRTNLQVVLIGLCLTTQSRVKPNSVLSYNQTELSFAFRRQAELVSKQNGQLINI